MSVLALRKMLACFLILILYCSWRWHKLCTLLPERMLFVLAIPCIYCNSLEVLLTHSCTCMPLEIRELADVIGLLCRCGFTGLVAEVFLSGTIICWKWEEVAVKLCDFFHSLSPLMDNAVVETGIRTPCIQNMCFGTKQKNSTDVLCWILILYCSQKWCYCNM